MAKNPLPPRIQQSGRIDGLLTRKLILDVATKLFALQGYAATTSRQICTEAGVNVAAVNYHFGGLGELYAQVLIEAHRGMADADELEQIASRASPAANRLAALIEALVARAVVEPRSEGLRVLLRELAAPSEHMEALLAGAIFPKMAAISKIVGDFLTLPPADPRVARALFFVIGPLLGFMFAPEKLRKAAGSCDPARDAMLIAQEWAEFVSAGLAALRDAPAKRPPTQ